MGNSILKLSTLLCLMLPACLMAQVQKGEIKKGDKHTVEVTQNENHQYKVKLGKNTSSYFKLVPKGVDMGIRTFDANGKKLGEFNTFRKNGLEKFIIVSDNKGEYIIEVFPVNEKEPKGHYELSVDRVKQKGMSTEEKVDELFAAWAGEGTPGAAVAIVKDGKIVYKQGYGMANLEYPIPLTPTTVFDLASLSKQITAFSMLLLEKEGKLDLDDDVRKYIPEVPNFGKKITLRHLASHTSGLRDQWALLEMAGWRVPDVITQKDVMEMVRRQKELNFAPGDEFLYSNTGYFLLAEVISRVSGKPFSEFLESRIFQPLQMNNSLVFDDYDKIVKNRAYPYYTTSNGFKKGILNIGAVGQGNIFADVNDLGLWITNLMDPKVGDKAIVSKMNTPVALNNGETFGGGLGQFISQYKGLNEVQHKGRTGGFNSFVTYFPDQKFSVIVLSNSSSFDPNGMAYKIADIYLDGQFKETQKQVAKAPESAIKQGVDTSIRLKDDVLKSYYGNYELQLGVTFRVSGANGQLIGEVDKGSTFKLLPISTKEFLIEGSDVKVVFVANGEKEFAYIELHEDERVTKMKRVEPFDKSTVVLSDYTGEFRSEELTVDYDIKIIDGQLIAKPKNVKLTGFSLKPVKKDTFLGSSPLFQEIKFIRDDKNAIVGFRVSNERVKNLYFEKMNRQFNSSL